jgi:hypothetical protein
MPRPAALNFYDFFHTNLSNSPRRAKIGLLFRHIVVAVLVTGLVTGLVIAGD